MVPKDTLGIVTWPQEICTCRERNTSGDIDRPHLLSSSVGDFYFKWFFNQNIQPQGVLGLRCPWAKTFRGYIAISHTFLKRALSLTYRNTSTGTSWRASRVDEYGVMRHYTQQTVYVTFVWISLWNFLPFIMLPNTSQSFLNYDVTTVLA